MNILICGLNNYVGRRCTSLMADADFQLFAITRNKRLYESRMAEPIRSEVFEFDLLKGSVEQEIPFPNMEASFYFTQVPALDDQVNLNVELLCLRNFIHVLKRMNCNRIIYVARLMDRRFLQPVLDLLKEFRTDYTVILKNVVMGKGCLIYNVSQQASDRNLLFYSAQYARSMMQPLGVHDFVRWLKAMLRVPSFHYRVMEVGGEEAISAFGLYDLYRKLKIKLQQQRLVALPNWLFGLVYRRAIKDYTETAEYLHVIKANTLVDNRWKDHMPFTFSSLQEILLAE